MASSVDDGIKQAFTNRDDLANKEWTLSKPSSEYKTHASIVTTSSKFFAWFTWIFKIECYWGFNVFKFLPSFIDI